MLESDTNWDCSSDDEETLADESMPRSYIDSVNVRLRVDDIDELLLRKARDEVGAVLLRLRLCMFGASPSDPALVAELARVLCAKIAYVADVSIIYPDDDMIRTRSQAVADLGLVHVRNPKKKGQDF
ncbi:hypothetical protein AM587_10006938 [Phytophthora nicotianae]|uniref:Uncharacterized protein n=1 Tax=Phytophthora nicotianae TaxID=4792 RepID=A0A0W8D3N5_PHYNI|nr:hypothetical protein AM587_10006938 [Phytophthora nicotianae]